MSRFITSCQFGQFSQTITHAALSHQHDIRDANEAFATLLTGYAETNNLTWPFVTVPLFEKYASCEYGRVCVVLFYMKLLLLLTRLHSLSDDRCKASRGIRDIGHEQLGQNARSGRVRELLYGACPGVGRRISQDSKQGTTYCWSGIVRYFCLHSFRKCLSCCCLTLLLPFVLLCFQVSSIHY